MIRSMHLGSMGNCKLGNLSVGDQIATMRPGCSQKFQHIANMPGARIQHARDLPIAPGLNDLGGLRQRQRLPEGAGDLY